jgi:hypothetical protein
MEQRVKFIASGSLASFRQTLQTVANMMTEDGFRITSTSTFVNPSFYYATIVAIKED